VLPHPCHRPHPLNVALTTVRTHSPSPSPWPSPSPYVPLGKYGLDVIPLPRTMARAKATEMVNTIVAHLMIQVNAHLSDTLDYSDAVYLFVFKRSAARWAKERQQAFMNQVGTSYIVHLTSYI